MGATKEALIGELGRGARGGGGGGRGGRGEEGGGGGERGREGGGVGGEGRGRLLLSVTVPPWLSPSSQSSVRGALR